MKLSISERFALASVLPPTGDILTLRDLRLLKEDLSVDEEDRKEVQFFNEFECPECKTKDIFPAPVKCGKCDVWMKMTGQVSCSNWEFTKEIHIPDYLVVLITATLKRMNDDKKLAERHIGIYERFVEAEEKPKKKKKD